MNQLQRLPVAMSMIVAASVGVAGSASATAPPTASATDGSLSADCDPATVTLTTMYRSFADSAMAAAAAAMEERHPGLTIEQGSSAATSYDELTQQVVADIAADRQVDMVMAGNNQVRFYVDTFAPTPLDVTSLRGTYDQRLLEIGTVEGEIYMAPFQVSFPALFFNVDLMEEVGLDPEAPPETFSELIDAATALQDVSEAGALYLPLDTVADWIFQAAVQSAGGVFVNPDGSPGFDTEAGRTGLALYADAAGAGVLDPITHAEGVAAFATGSTPMFISTIALTAQVAEAVGDSFAWDVTPMPVADGGSANYPAGGNGWLVLTDDPCRAALASELIGELLSPEVVAEALRTGSYVPVDSDAREILLNDPEIPAQQLLAYGYEGTFTPWGGWPGDTAPEANQIVTDMVRSVVEGASVDEAITSAHAELVALTSG